MPCVNSSDVNRMRRHRLVSNPLSIPAARSKYRVQAVLELHEVIAVACAAHVSIAPESAARGERTLHYSSLRSAAWGMPGHRHARNCIRGGIFVKTERKRAASGNVPVHSAILKILRQDQLAALQLRCADDQTVPPAQLVSMLDFASALHQRLIGGLRFPAHQSRNVIPSLISGQPTL